MYYLNVTFRHLFNLPLKKKAGLPFIYHSKRKLVGRACFFFIFLFFLNFGHPGNSKKSKKNIFLIFLNFGHPRKENWWEWPVFFFDFFVFFDFFEFWSSRKFKKIKKKQKKNARFFFDFFVFFELWPSPERKLVGMACFFFDFFDFFEFWSSRKFKKIKKIKKKC